MSVLAEGAVRPLPFRFDPEWTVRTEDHPWAQTPDATAGNNGLVYLLTREPGAIRAFDAKTGTHVTSFGEGVLSPRPHGLTFGRDGLLYVADSPHHVVRVFTVDGEQVAVIGSAHQPSASGADYDLEINFQWRSVRRGAPPFNRPAKVASTLDGGVLVADGYANARVHRFTADHRLVASWGEPGIGLGQFNNVHSVTALADGRVLAADREGDRLQVFSADGDFLDVWAQPRRPTAVVEDPHGRVLVTELGRAAGEDTARRGVVPAAEPAAVRVVDGSGNLLYYGTSFPGGPAFAGPHSISLAPDGTVYVADLAAGVVLRALPADNGVPA
ncbi:NHL repeat-containing protein [Actinophytocola sediminis]